MDIKELEIMKKKYEKQYKNFKKKYTELREDEIDLIFIEWTNLKEKEKKLKAKIKAIKERERKNEARALIIFAKILLKLYINENDLKTILNHHQNEFLVKSGKKKIDLTEYIKNIYYKK